MKLVVRLECQNFTSTSEKEMEMQEPDNKRSRLMQLCWLLDC